MQNAELHRFLAARSVSEISDRIAAFRRINLRRLTSIEISQKIQDVLIDPPGFALYPCSIREYKQGTEFFRVRRPVDSSGKIPMDCVVSEADAWEPPAKFVKANRLNKANEPLLYVTPNALQVALAEARVPEGDPVAIFVYNASRNIRVNVIGDRFEDLSLDPVEKQKLLLWVDFLHDEFTRDAGPENEHIYRLSEVIAKDWFDLPPRDVQDAWCYPSVVSKPQFNVCFRPELAHECLTLVGALIGFHERENIRVKMVTNVENGKFSYHLLGSAMQRSLFPRISLEAP